MKHDKAISFLACVLVTALCAACSDDHHRRGDDELAVETGGTSAAGASGDGESGDRAGFGGVGGSVELEPERDASVEPSFEAFEIELNQSVTIGAFVLGIDKAIVSPDRALFDERAKIEIPFVATNASTELLRPFDRLFSEELLLEINGEYFFGEVYAEKVPGLRQGVGTITWTVPAVALSPEQIRAGTITLGGADDNAVVIPLADPAATVTLNDIPLDVAFVIQGHRESTLEITSARVEFGSRKGNTPYEAGKARLVLVGGLGAIRLGENWQGENAALLRPDGISVAPYQLNELVQQQPIDIEIQFNVQQPIAGTYEFVVIDEVKGESPAQSIVVP